MSLDVFIAPAAIRAMRDGFGCRARRGNDGRPRWRERVSLNMSFTETRIMRNASLLTLDELAEEREFNVVGHDVWGALDIATLHEEFKVGHDLVLQLLEPLVKFHVLLVRLRIIVLAAPGFAPVRFS